jgi:Pectate lyase superfamily protein
VHALERESTVAKIAFVLANFILIVSQSCCGVTGAIAQDASAHGAWTDVRAFGAVGDGKADDTAAIQRAIDYTATTTQGVVFFPPGGYKITDRLKVDRNVDLMGVGIAFGSQIIPINTDAITILGTDWPGGHGFRNHIKGLTIMMNHADGKTAIVIDHAYTIKIENVMVFNAGSGGGISIANAAHVTLADVNVYGMGTGLGTGIAVKDSNVNLNNPDIEAFFNGLQVTGDQGVHLFGGHLERNAAYGIRFDRASYNTIIGAKISAPNAQGITIGFLDGSSSNTIIGSRLEAYRTGFVLYQDVSADRQNTVMGSYLNGRVSKGIKQQ